MRYFNTAGSCEPQLHYMVDIQDKLAEIKALVDKGAYFTVNRARQYGKTTTLAALAEYLERDYVVLTLDFQRIGNEEFENAQLFSTAFSEYLLDMIENNMELEQELDANVLNRLREASETNSALTLRKLFSILSRLCKTAQKPVVLIIDEVDSATNNQVFLDFLAQLRSYYLARSSSPTFRSVILAGVYDIKNIRRKIRPEEAHKTNSPWNIATDFKVNMSFSRDGIAGMLREYEADHHTGMNVEELSVLLYDYTSGYPFLVSKLCKLIDESVAGTEQFPKPEEAWTKEGFLEAVKLLLYEKNTLFESLMGKLTDYPEMAEMIYELLFSGSQILYNPDETWMDMAVMFGFIRNHSGTVKIANRIFEIRLYNYFLAVKKSQNSEIFKIALRNKTQYIRDGRLDMKLVLEKYVEHFDSIYGNEAEPFNEEEGRRRFLLYLRPIINGVGNYYIEAETRNERRMDVVVDYLGEQFIVELKIWRGNAYKERGEEQISDYLDYFRLKKGYMLSYNFNKKKEIGVTEIPCGDRTLVEAVV